MVDNNSDVLIKNNLLAQALARWENEGGDTLPIDFSPADGAEYTQIPEMTNVELVALRVRLIALENVLISLLATASDHQLKLIREMAGYIPVSILVRI